ncbi:Substrate-binding region of ABC-type glycine betaine transport system [Desulfonatronospira thiodismutans ASO3-1]|uniref:Substrate-binding region of ABC-type glycine betaine transport system n=1 Tax=Desulfonatronospira thiodismutans ASO3-1 TaxID=555779 RepID=D6SPB2_9BACT|nr:MULTISPECIES: glycine betaine ABC transporter substrate-binding protein [Desulfonatronospira]EFI34588.1 Substrate-binding region of ABC-type glycine betaine transport system [Desulfonatronospira thiodismutans ASO3-1]RQD76413.1 MAG: glycine betaine ABC transporter substrate-binding protein [Desulfonatronospira sp. MSAO_Bac3]
MIKKGLAVLSVLALLMGFASSNAGAQDRLTLAYVEWDCAVASTDVAKAVLQEELGYNVESMSVSAAAMWQGVASGDVDAHVAAWLPVTHGDYMDATEGQLEDLGKLTDGAKIGLVVPEYVDIDSIEDLNDYADEFNGRITGIDPGAGIMSRTEEALDEYGLTEFELQEGSDATMSAALRDATRRDEWIVVTGWSPHWKFGRWDLKYLEDPKEVYGEAEHISKMARQGLADDAPEAYEFLKNFSWTQEEMAVLMEWNEDGGDSYENAVRFIEEHPDLVDQWLGR